MKKYEGLKQSGTFHVDGKDLIGELSVNGADTALKVYSREFFDAKKITARSIFGVFHDGKKVSLLECLTAGTGSGHLGSDSYNYAEFNPHYVAFGDEHITADDQVIDEVSFIIDDDAALFCDFDAFSSVLDARPFIEQIVNANAEKTERRVVTGEYPQIVYFTGKSEIVTAETAIGRISATHNPSWDHGSPKGVRIDNSLFISIKFPTPQLLEEAVNRVLTLLRFIEIVVGRPQNILKLNLRLASKGDELQYLLDVYWCRPPHREEESDGRAPHHIDVLLDGAGRPDEFARILQLWIEREQQWRSARVRFSQCFRQQDTYYIDRLIGAANMFDILPVSACPPDVTLSPELLEARRQSRAIFLDLPQSLERDSVLGELGRLGKSKLKHKVRHRAKPIIDAVGNVFPELELVVDEAINCRNYFVHGTAARIDYPRHFDVFYFLTNTLEFVFAASDLVEAGWDIKVWTQQGTTMSHPFGTYRASYREHLQKLKAVLLQREAAE